MKNVFNAKHPLLGEMPSPLEKTFINWQVEAISILKQKLGIPDQKTSLNPEKRGEIEYDDVVIEKWILTAEEGSKLPSILYRPKNISNEVLPAVILAFGHTASKSHPIYNYLGQLFAKLNILCLAIDPIGEEERDKERRIGTKSHDEDRVYQTAAKYKRSIMGKFIFDSMRGIDFLFTRPDIDNRRIGVVGNSLGGAVASWLAVLDERISCALVSGWGYTKLLDKYGMPCTTQSNQYITTIMEWHEFLTLAAPHCSIFVANGDADTVVDCEGTGQAWLETNEAISLANKNFDLLGNTLGISTWYEVGGGHRTYPAYPQPLSWLVDKLHPYKWQPEDILRLPRINLDYWLTKNNGFIEPFYRRNENEGGSKFVDLNIKYMSPDILQVLDDQEIGKPEFTIEGWLTKLKEKQEKGRRGR